MLKLKIDNEALANDFFEDARLLGIVAPLKYYRFSWSVNQWLGFNFRINNSLEIPLKKKDRKYYFPVFEYYKPGKDRLHYLYNNQYDGEFLLPEFRNLDFLWLIKDSEIGESEVSDLITRLRPIPGVQLVSELLPEKIKNKQNLIL
ncbi:MAG: IPExxxVDY family protein [Chitinophagaceae bacterium]|nr:IPExxxVDY family protein [Chitinophagaceae bacterium]